jgi:TonB family protein
MQKIPLLLLLIGQVTAGTTPKLRWENFHGPEYPRTAQIAHISGTVIVEFTIGSNGTVAIQEATGHPLLVPAAEQTIRRSKISCDHCENHTGAFEVVFRYRQP